MNFLMLFSLGSLIKKFKLYTNGYAAVTETLVNLFFQCRKQEFYNSHATIKFMSILLLQMLMFVMFKLLTG